MNQRDGFGSKTSFGRQKPGRSGKFCGIRISGLQATIMVDRQRREDMPNSKLLLFSKLAIKADAVTDEAGP